MIEAGLRKPTVAIPRGLQVETLAEALRRRLTPKQLAELLNQAEPT
jgi:hypothetical protein